uniref:Organic solute transporter subunit alpha n=1 Tax=Ornithorhynchus anatinus TaxID=9258 RepID=A0A6I8NMF9_ORNAN
MEDARNATRESACQARQAPFSGTLLQSLDLKGRYLFATLTLMTLVAYLVFLEEVFYIYRKIPPSKRSIFIWINASSPVIALTSCLGMWIPRATMFTDFAAGAFFAIVIHKFLLMMIKECGGQKMFLRRFQPGRFKISTGPCCCCCFCLPLPHITSGSLFWLKVGTFQLALLQPVLVLLAIVLWTNGTYSLSDLSPRGAAVWLGGLGGVLTVVALWPVGILFHHVRGLLAHKNISPKFALFQVSPTAPGRELGSRPRTPFSSRLPLLAPWPHGPGFRPPGPGIDPEAGGWTPWWWAGWDLPVEVRRERFRSGRSVGPSEARARTLPDNRDDNGVG